MRIDRESLNRARRMRREMTRAEVILWTRLEGRAPIRSSIPKKWADAGRVIRPSVMKAGRDVGPPSKSRRSQRAATCVDGACLPFQA
jgi:hypothetical protein